MVQIVTLLLIVLTLLSLWGLLYQLMRQQGRILLRLDALEERLSVVGANGVAGRPPIGLSVGAAVPPFQLPDLWGRPVALEDFRGKKALLVNWSPSCGFCLQIAPNLARMQPDLRAHNTELLLISDGDAEANRRLAAEHGLDCHILLRGNSGRVEAFAMHGTPVAYLVDEEGRVAEPLAVGANEVPILAATAVHGKRTTRLRSQRSLRDSKIERNGLKPGTQAPPFRLPDVRGGTLSLEDYLGRPVVLVFTDPQCGPCETVAVQLAALQSDLQRGNLSILMISRGDDAETTRKIEQHGIIFPTGLQPGWTVSRQYGIFLTPVAFAIDPDGVIAQPVAKGPAEILALVRDVLTSNINGKPDSRVS